MLINPEVLNEDFQNVPADTTVYVLKMRHEVGLLAGTQSYHPHAYTTREEAEGHWWFKPPLDMSLLFPATKRAVLKEYEERDVEIVEMTMLEYLKTLHNPCNPFVAVNMMENLHQWVLNNR